MAMLLQTAKIKRLVLDFLFPRWCIGCGREGDFICHACYQRLPRIDPPVCPRCGQPQADGWLCSACRGQPTSIDGMRAPFRFEGIIREAIHQLKYNNLRALSEPLAGLLGDYYSRHNLPGEVLVPVPVHEKRLKERGYNQSRLLARELGKLLDLPLIDDCLIRQRHAPAQTRTKTVEERRRNVAEAYSCRDQRLKGRKVLIRYYGVCDESGKYLGTLEVGQDITDIKEIEGEKRLLEF